MKILASQEGFTIVEVLVSMGIVAMALVMMAQLSVQGQKIGKSQSLDIDFSIIESNIQNVLSYDCKKALATQAFAAGPTPNPSVTLAPYAPVAVASPSVGMQVQSLSFNQTPIYITTDPSGVFKQYLANFNVTAKKVSGMAVGNNNGILPGTQTYSKDMSIYVWVDSTTNQITDCQSDSSAITLTTATPTGVCVGPPATPLTWAITNYVSATLTGDDGSTWTLTPPSPGSVLVGAATPILVTYTLTAMTNAAKTETATVTVQYSNTGACAGYTPCDNTYAVANGFTTGTCPTGGSAACTAGGGTVSSMGGTNGCLNNPGFCCVQ